MHRFLSALFQIISVLAVLTWSSLFLSKKTLLVFVQLIQTFHLFVHFRKVLKFYCSHLTALTSYQEWLYNMIFSAKNSVFVFGNWVCLLYILTKVHVPGKKPSTTPALISLILDSSLENIIRVMSRVSFAIIYTNI